VTTVLLVLTGGALVAVGMWLRWLFGRLRAVEAADTADCPWPGSCCPGRIVADGGQYPPPTPEGQADPDAD
jgi:hypothetical protein